MGSAAGSSRPRVLLRALLVTAVLAASSAAHADVDKTSTAGLGVAVSIGYQSPALGAQVSYYIPLPNRAFTLTPHAGAGWVPIEIGEDTDEFLGVGVGVMVALGRRHRGFVDLSFGTVGAEYFNEDPATRDVVFGNTGALGYEFLGTGGFIFRASAGGTYSTVELDDRHVSFTLNLALGYKIF